MHGKTNASSILSNQSEFYYVYVWLPLWLLLNKELVEKSKCVVWFQLRQPSTRKKMTKTLETQNHRMAFIDDPKRHTVKQAIKCPKMTNVLLFKRETNGRICVQNNKRRKYIANSYQKYHDYNFVRQTLFNDDH